MSNENNSANNADNNANDVDSANNNVDTNASNVNNVPVEVDSEAETEVFAKPAVPDNVYARTEDKSSTTNETTETATAKPEEPKELESTEPKSKEPEPEVKSQVPEPPKPEILAEANDASSAYKSTYHTDAGNVGTHAHTGVDTVNNDTANNESNWPDFLVDHKNQQLFGLATITLGAFTGLIGSIFAAYYLFYLDDSEKKDKSAKLMSYVGLALPIISILIFLLFFFPVFFISLA